MTSGPYAYSIRPVPPAQPVFHVILDSLSIGFPLLLDPQTGRWKPAMA
jgi:hypothetical protein